MSRPSATLTGLMSRNASAIAAEWTLRFGDFAPLGFVCRGKLHSRWVRIHSLPGSKRYPDSEPEYTELLRRHNEAATIVLGDGEACIAFFVSFGEEEEPPFLDAVTIPELSSFPDAEDCTIAAAPIVWQQGHFDRVIRAVADETFRGVLIANLRRRTAYAPYDGGADLIFESQDAARQGRDRLSDWLSMRADGL